MCQSRARPCTWSESLVTTLKNEPVYRENRWKRRLGAKKNYKKYDIDQTRVLFGQCLASVATMRGNITNSFDQLCWYHTAQYDKNRWDQCKLIIHKIAAVQHNKKCYSGHLMKIPVFFHIAIYIKGLKKSHFFPILCSPSPQLREANHIHSLI